MSAHAIYVITFSLASQDPLDRVSFWLQKVKAFVKIIVLLKEEENKEAKDRRQYYFYQQNQRQYKKYK